MSLYVQLGVLQEQETFVKIVNRKLGSTVFKVIHQNVKDLFNKSSVVVENQDTKELISLKQTEIVFNLQSE